MAELKNINICAVKDLLTAKHVICQKIEQELIVYIAVVVVHTVMQK